MRKVDCMKIILFYIILILFFAVSASLINKKIKYSILTKIIQMLACILLVGVISYWSIVSSVYTKEQLFFVLKISGFIIFLNTIGVKMMVSTNIHIDSNFIINCLILFNTVIILYMMYRFLYLKILIL